MKPMRLLLVGLLLAACSDGKDDEDDSPASSADAPAAQLGCPPITEVDDFFDFSDVDVSLSGMDTCVYDAVTQPPEVEVKVTWGPPITDPAVINHTWQDEWDTNKDCIARPCHVGGNLGPIEAEIRLRPIEDHTLITTTKRIRHETTDTFVNILSRSDRLCRVGLTIQGGTDLLSLQDGAAAMAQHYCGV